MHLKTQQLSAVESLMYPSERVNLTESDNPSEKVNLTESDENNDCG